MKQRNRPNVAILLLDCARADRLSCYGHRRPTTPRIDRLAEESTLFERAVSPSIWTLESVTSLFTGLYPTQHQTHYGQPNLDRSVPTLAQWLADLGYETRSATRNPWIVPETGLTRGFDTAIDIRAAARMGPMAKWARKAAAAGLPLGAIRNAWQALNSRIEARMHDAGASRINTSIEQWLDAREQSRPFFLFVDYMEAHGPYSAPEVDRFRFLPEGVDRETLSRVPLESWTYHADPSLLTPENLQILDGLYSGALSYLDRKIGEVVDLFERKGILDDTVLVITADHGENLGEHGLVGHNYCVYDTLAHVPLICRYPGAFPRGLRADRLVQSIDLLPTLEEILSSAAPEHSSRSRQGVSLVGGASEGDSRRHALIEYLEPNLDLIRARRPDVDLSEFDRAWRAIRDERWKLARASDGTLELYDLENDSGETNELSNVHPEIVNALCRELDRWVEELGGDNGRRWSRTNSPTGELSGEMRERLAAFGYL
ncbi:MAG: sulfatase [Gemmatimonadetes bacterium]|nr:sulfatase [Gemmatimonadota bacterium]